MLYSVARAVDAGNITNTVIILIYIIGLCSINLLYFLECYISWFGSNLMFRGKWLHQRISSG